MLARERGHSWRRWHVVRRAWSVNGQRCVKKVGAAGDDVEVRLAAADFRGRDLAAARVPIRNVLAAPAASNHTRSGHDSFHAEAQDHRPKPSSRNSIKQTISTPTHPRARLPVFVPRLPDRFAVLDAVAPPPAIMNRPGRYPSSTTISLLDAGPPCELCFHHTLSRSLRRVISRRALGLDYGRAPMDIVGHWL